MEAATGWQTYLSWNTVVVDAVYPPVDNRRIAFLDLEGDALEKVAEKCGIGKDAVVPSLVSACRGVINLHRRTSAFERFAIETKKWAAGDRLDPPPAVALLATFSLAAERMERDDGVAAHNYYAQLARVLKLDETRVAVDQSYRNVSEPLWDSLVTWLTYQEGRRGNPVTFSVGENRHIGRAKAQALVRDVDRRRFQAFFQEFDLSPGSELADNELEELLQVWIQSSRAASTHIRGLWEQSSARPHIVTAAANALAAWDGHLTNRHKVGTAASRIRITLARRRLRRGIDIGVSLNVPEYEEARNALVQTSDGDISVPLEPGRPGEMKGIGVQDIVEPRSLLEGILEITDPVAGALKRLPRRLVVLRQDPFAAVWHEVSQVRLGDAVSLLVDTSLDIGDVLSEISGSAWTVHEHGRLPGLPQGWRLIEGVTVVSRPSRPLDAFDDLGTLVPITQTAFSFSDGLVLPVGDRHYHVNAPPVVTIGTGGGKFTATLFDLEDDHPLLIQEPWTSDGDPLSIPIGELDLDAGRYGLMVHATGERPREREFTLARSGEVDLEHEYDSITHDARTGLGVVCADNNQGAGLPIEGVPLFDLEAEQESGSFVDHDLPAQVPWWRRDRKHEPRALPVVATPAPDSCLRTGVHVEMIEQATLNHRLKAVGTTFGVCQGCGRVKQYSNSYWRNHKDWERKRNGQETPPRQSRTFKARTRTLGSSVDWDLALDMVMALGGGDVNQLRRLTRQFDPSARFLHEFIDTLQSVGHIEVERDPFSTEIIAWETAPTTIVECGDHRRLSGHWTSSLLAEIRRAGIQVRLTPQVTAPSVRTTTSPADDILEHVPDAHLVCRPDLTLARSLPVLSEVLHALPSADLPDVLTFERYSPARDSWSPISTAVEQGAYRTTAYRRDYYVLVDSAEGRGRRVSAAMAKHAAALLSEEPRTLIAYSPKDRELIVPLGAPVPGLYGRALGLASGHARKRRDVGQLGSFEVYPEIPAELASTVQRLLGS